ncbi:MAG: hypothetical protein AAF626_07795 [Pseudomonadota bacterium]
MSVNIDPTVNISPLFFLVRGQRLNETDFDAIATPGGSRSVNRGLPQDRPGEWSRQSLQRDGKRPLVFFGQFLLERHQIKSFGNCLDCDIEMTTRFYLEANQNVYLHRILIPGNAVAALPVSRACQLQSKEEYQEFDSFVTFERCFDATPAQML